MTPTACVLAAIAAAFVGLSKTGVPGVSIPAVLLMAEVFPSDVRQSVGAILPLMLAGDVFAVRWYRQHADWGRLVRLLPYVVLGMLPGVFVLVALDSRQLRPVIGGMVLGLLALEVCRRWFGWTHIPHRWWFAAITGFLAGLTTFVANAAMPVMSIYLVSQDFDKDRFIGTAAWFFFILNLSKLPAYCAMGMITPAMLPMTLWLAPVTLAGALLGVYVLARIPQRLFNGLALSLAGAVALRLLVTA
jgi:uncharacterized membrane protein YfcA